MCRPRLPARRHPRIQTRQLSPDLRFSQSSDNQFLLCLLCSKRRIGDLLLLDNQRLTKNGMADAAADARFRYFVDLIVEYWFSILVVRRDRVARTPGRPVQCSANCFLIISEIVLLLALGAGKTKRRKGSGLIISRLNNRGGIGTMPPRLRLGLIIRGKSCIGKVYFY